LEDLEHKPIISGIKKIDLNMSEKKKDKSNEGIINFYERRLDEAQTRITFLEGKVFDLEVKNSKEEYYSKKIQKIQSEVILLTDKLTQMVEENASLEEHVSQLHSQLDGMSALLDASREVRYT
jgi:chromosome segregation ATPase